MSIRENFKNVTRNEPVIVGTLIPLLVTVGFLTTDQATALTNLIAGAVAFVAQIAVAVKVRASVRPTVKD